MNKPVNICFPYWGGAFGGSHISSLALVQELRRAYKHQYRPVVVLHSEDVFSEYLREKDIPYELLSLKRYVGQSRGLGQLAIMAETSFKIMRYMRQKNISLIHGNEDDVNYTWALPAKLARVKHVWHVRALSKRSRLNNLLRLSSRVPCVSNFVATSLPEYARCKSQTIVDPVSFEETVSREQARNILLPELGEPQDALLVCFIGNFLAGKRADVFIRATAIMAREYSERSIKFLLFGDDREGQSTSLKTLARELGINESIHFMGFRSDIEQCIKACDLVISPAENEGLGRLVVEPMLLGVPVVAARSGGILEVVTNERTGLLANPGDAMDFAMKGLRILQDDDFCKQLTTAAYKEAVERYSPVRHGRRITALYERLLS